MKASFLLSLLLLTIHTSAAVPESSVLSMVPKGKVLFKNHRDYTLKTAAGTKVKVEFERKGKLQEASGLNLNKGDEFEPGGGMVTLSTAAQAVVKAGHQTSGEWNLEKDSELGWVYEIVETEGDKKVVHIVSAVTGRLMSSVTDESAR